MRDRQLVPQQISDSGANAVLLAPQLAVDAADSSAGKFWQPGGLKRFVTELADHLARLYGDPSAAKAFANMPVVIVGYSGGFVPTAWSLEVGGLGNRVRGVFLLDAGVRRAGQVRVLDREQPLRLFRQLLYPLHRTARPRADAYDQGERASPYRKILDGPLRPGSVVFVETPEGVTHRSYVTHAWTENPVKEVLVKMASTPALTRVAASSADISASR